MQWKPRVPNRLRGTRRTHILISPSCPAVPLATLPQEIIIQIISHLGPADSTCVGLTCRHIYRAHWEIHGPRELAEITIRMRIERSRMVVGSYCRLRERVAPWMSLKYGYCLLYSVFRPRIMVGRLMINWEECLGEEGSRTSDDEINE